MRFELEDNLRGAADKELLDELRRCARRLGRDTVTIAQYRENGRGHPCTVRRRFGSWTKALARAGLQPSRSKIGISEEELFEDLRVLWISLGRQPKYSEVGSPNSRYSAGTYQNRFGSWTKALRAFVDWINRADGRRCRNEPRPARTSTVSSSSMSPSSAASGP
ncbi:MAG: homing endonuclease associated repeat-containing protein [Planctomycetota bacterium]